MTITKTSRRSSSSSSSRFGMKNYKTVSRSKWIRDVNTFLILFASIQRQTGVPRSARLSYTRHMRNCLLCNGHGFLSKTRSYPIYGLRYLAGDIEGDRSPDTFFEGERLRANADGVLVPKFLSWYWNELLKYSKKKNPNKTDAIRISRILAVLSFSKFLVKDTRKARKRAMEQYIKRVTTPNGKVPLEFNMLDDNPEYMSMLEFLKLFRHHKFAGNRVQYDRHCYSLKCLVGKKPYRPFVPPAYSVPNYQNLFNFDVESEEYPNDLVSCVQRYYYTTKPFDAKLTIIPEAGGKYRGICPYNTPYAHTLNLYRRASTVLRKIPGNCNYSQDRGHSVARYLSHSRKNHVKVSVDASNFTDEINVELLAYMAKALGSSGAVHYCSRLRVQCPDGKVVKGCPPLMGWKGTFDLASVVLAWSVWKQFGCLDSNRVQCGDDFLGIGTLEEFRAAYEYLGLSLSENKTVVSKTCTIFCGKMFWLGLDVTPVRFIFTGSNDNNKFIGKLIARARDFVVRCNYSKACKRTIFKYLRRSLGRRYKGYLDFRLSSELGGVPLMYYPVGPLLPYLENNKKALECALLSIPFAREERTWQHDNFSHLPLGKPYNIYGLCSSLTEGSWPRKSRTVISYKRRIVRGLLDSNRAGVSDVLEYMYYRTPLTA